MMNLAKSIATYIAPVIFSACFLACGTEVKKESSENNYKTIPVTSVEAAKKIVIEKFKETKEVLLIPDSLNDPAGMNMAIIGNTILSKGYIPAGLEKKEGYIIYKYQKHEAVLPTAPATPKSLKPFFEFDAIDYYFIAANKTDREKLTKSKTDAKLRSIEQRVIYGNIPQIKGDTSYVAQLDKIGFKKNSVDTGKFEAMNNLFALKEGIDSVAYACKPIYRDILVFRKNGRIAGIAKVCFSCRKFQITGAKENTDSFGQDGDYERLQQLLHEY